MDRPRRLLVVCLGNHCRSPAAEAILTQLAGGPLGRTGRTVQVRSAGLVDKWVGKSAHPAMIAAAARRGYDLTGHRGTQLDPNLLAWADLLVAMDNQVLTVLHTLTEERTDARLALYLGDRDVPDPWGQPDAVFDACVELIEVGAHRLLTSLANRPVER